MKNEPIVIKDGEAVYQRFVNELNEMNSKIIELSKEWTLFEPILGKFSIEWLSAFLNGSAFNRAENIICEKAKEERADQAATFENYYLSRFDELVRLFNSLHIGNLDDRDYPRHLRNLSGFSLSKNGGLDLNAKFLQSIRPDFDEVLTDPADIEFFHLLSSAADSINELIAAAEKRGFMIIGNSFTQLFANRRIGEKVKPNTDRLKFKLSLKK